MQLLQFIHNGIRITPVYILPKDLIPVILECDISQIFHVHIRQKRAPLTVYVLLFFFFCHVPKECQIISCRKPKKEVRIVACCQLNYPREIKRDSRAKKSTKS